MWRHWWDLPPTQLQPFAFLPGWPQQLQRWNPPASLFAASTKMAVGLDVWPVHSTLSGLILWKNLSRRRASRASSPHSEPLGARFAVEPVGHEDLAVVRVGDSGTGWFTAVAARAADTLRGNDAPEEGLHAIDGARSYVGTESGC